MRQGGILTQMPGTRRFLVLSLLALAASLGARGALPYRFLVVIGDQWADPASHVLEPGGEFQALVALLKTWGLPFEILRLDQQLADRYHLLERDGGARYGTLILTADPAALRGKDFSVIAELVREHGAGLVLLGNSVTEPALAELAGLEYESEFRLPYGLSFEGESFITRGLAGREQEFGEGGEIPGSKVMAREAKTLVRRGHLPFLTVREPVGNGRVAWLGAHRGSAQLVRQIVRDLLKRTLVWAQGYALYKEYPYTMMLFVDDFGTSDRTYLPYWHYRTLNQQDIRRNIIEPLRRHNAVLMQNVLTGFVDRQARRVVSPWIVQRVDELDKETFHDYLSARRGLDEGLRLGVFEIQSHGYTHMLPDLESPPGPFWDAPLDGAATLGFDYEFRDALRNREVPAITQQFLLARSLEYIREDFGTSPLFVIAGGGQFSASSANHSRPIAAQMGFGLGNFRGPDFLSHKLVVPLHPIVGFGGWSHERRLTFKDIPWTIDGPYFLTFHDRDVSLDPGSLARRLELSPGLGRRSVRGRLPGEFAHGR